MKSVDYRITAFGLASNPDHVPRRHECCTTASRNGVAFVLLHACLRYTGRRKRSKEFLWEEMLLAPHPPPHPYPIM